MRIRNGVHAIDVACRMRRHQAEQFILEEETLRGGAESGTDKSAQEVIDFVGGAAGEF